MTMCNHCTYKMMQREAKKRGTKTFIVRHLTGEWKGWVSAYYKDQPNEPAIRFMELPSVCRC